MESKIIIVLNFLLSFSKFVFCDINAVQNVFNERQIHQAHFIGDSINNNINVPTQQINFPPNLNEKQLFANNIPVNNYQPVNAYRSGPLSTQGDNQINNYSILQPSNLLPNGFLANGINESTQIKQSNKYLPQLNTEKQVVRVPVLQANENPHLNVQLRKPLRNINFRPYQNYVDTKTATTAQHPSSLLKKSSVINDNANDPRKQHYQTRNFLSTSYNKNNISRLGNNEGTLSRDKNIPIQQPVTNKRYTLVHKNGAIEYYDDLKAILKKYPHIKLPQNIRPFSQSQNPAINKQNQDPQNIKAPLVGGPATNVHIPLNQHHNNLFQGQFEYPLNNFQIPVSQNNGKVTYNIHNDKRIPSSATTYIPTKFEINETTRKPAVKEPVLNNEYVTPSKVTENEKNKQLTNKVDGMTGLIRTIKKEDAVGLNNGRKQGLSSSNLDSRILHQVKHPAQEGNSDIIVTSSVLNKFEESINHTVDPKMNTGIKQNNTMDVKVSSSLSMGQNETVIASEKKSNKFTKSNISSFLQNPVKIDQKIEVNDTKIEIDSSIPDNSAQVLNARKSNVNNTQHLEQVNEIKATTIKTTDDFQSGDYHTDSLVQPIAWLKTNDSNFWTKLLDDGANSFLYIFNIQSHPRVEKDTKTIIHANGTIVEEITETTWVNDDDTPIITKSVKVTPATEIKH